MTVGCPVGVDVERMRPLPDMDQIAERTFSRQECAALRALPVALRPSGFFNCWTRKEAYIKAVGLGLSYPLERFSVSLAPGEPARLEAVEAEPGHVEAWTMAALAPRSGFVGAVVVGARPVDVRVRAVGGGPAMTVAELVAHLRALDVRLSVEGDRLRCSAPKGVLTDELRGQLATRKVELLGWLREHGERDGLEATMGREPASFPQQRLWFMDQLSPGGFAYNITGGLRIRGALNVEALERSLGELVRRHEPLRTVFAAVDGQPVQIVREADAFRLPVRGAAGEGARRDPRGGSADA